ncbi:MAG: histidine phosphatase family protein [Chloroflexi bacterium]|nr:histidine phosphatase family protein [Chloroflexota bacterium]
MLYSLLKRTAIFRIILVRHGQTDWNKEERFRGRFDIELNETGLKQAELAGQALLRLDVAAIFASPLKRALKTGEIIAARTGKPLSVTDGLIDIDFGEYQGLNSAEAKTKDETLWRKWLDSPQLVSFPGGESLASVEERVRLTIGKAREQQPGKTVVMVSHSVVCKVMVCHVIGLDLSHFWQIDQATGALSVFEERNSQLVASRINDSCHLKEIKN